MSGPKTVSCEDCAVCVFSGERFSDSARAGLAAASLTPEEARVIAAFVAGFCAFKHLGSDVLNFMCARHQPALGEAFFFAIKGPEKPSSAEVPS